MKQARYLLTTTILSVITLLSMTAQVDAAPYTFSVDRFESVGNLPGTFVDDFNDGVIGPNWEIDDPTAIESGGVVIFSNPGTPSSMTLGNLNISSQMSYISTRSPFLLADGQGDFSGTSTWSPIIPGMNQFYGMHISVEGTNEDIGIGVYNFDTSLADFFGITPGLAVYFLRTNDVSAGDFDAQSFSIDPADITSSILLRLSFDDDTNQFTGGFSLDGSTPDQGQFSSMAPTAPGNEFTWSLGTESWDVTPVPIPGAIWLFGSAILVFCRMQCSKRAMTC